MPGVTRIDGLALAEMRALPFFRPQVQGPRWKGFGRSYTSQDISPEIGLYLRVKTETDLRRRNARGEARRKA